MQPGSSIMPGKVNPVISEVINQIAFRVIGNDLTIAMLKNGMTTLGHRCIDGITANEDRCKEMVTNSIGLVTALNPILGYEVSTQVAKEALESDRGVYDIVLERKLMSQEELEEILRPENMIIPKKFLRK